MRCPKTPIHTVGWKSTQRDVLRIRERNVWLGTRGSSTVTFLYDHKSFSVKVLCWENSCFSRVFGNMLYLDNVPLSISSLGWDPLFIPIQLDHFYGGKHISQETSMAEPLVSKEAAHFQCFNQPMSFACHWLTFPRRQTWPDTENLHSWTRCRGGWKLQITVCLWGKDDRLCLSKARNEHHRDVMQPRSGFRSVIIVESRWLHGLIALWEWACFHWGLCRLKTTQERG